MWAQLFKVLVLLITALIAVLGVRTWQLGNRLPPPPAAGGPPAQLPAAELAETLGGALRIATISNTDTTLHQSRAFEELAAYLELEFPLVHANLRKTDFNGYGWLYQWQTAASGGPALLLLAHSDVVPIEPGTEAQWQQPPFSGAISDGYIWGRGALDDKSSLLGWLEALEYLLAQGFEPEQLILLAVGHDEEVGGQLGAKVIADYLRAEGTAIGLALDEGGAVTLGIVPGVARPVANIMAAEKGYVSLELTARADGGHSSTPPAQTAVGRLSRAVARLEAQQLPLNLRPPVTWMLERLSPALPLMSRVAIANRWLLEDQLIESLGGSRAGNALLRTTTAPTMLRAGIKDNVLATEARATVNFRILPGDTVALVEAHVRKVVDDAGIEIRRASEFVSEPSAPADINSADFQVISGAVRDLFPDVLISTGAVTGATDLRHYQGLYRQRFNFVPLIYRADDLKRFHGRNERVSVDDYVRMVQCYVRIIERYNGS